MLLMDLTVTITNSSLALAGAVIVVYDPRALPLLVVPLVTVFLAYRAYATERQRHESLEFLYETTRTLSRSPEIVGALEGLLARSVEAFRAEIAEIVLFPSEGNAPLRTTHGPGDVARRDAADRPRDRRRAARAGRPRRARHPRHARAPAACACAATCEERGVTHAMLAMLPGRDARGRHDAAGQPPRRRARLLRRRPAPVRDARHQRLGRAPVRPPRADRLAAARAPAPARAPGLPRLADRAGQPHAVHRPRRRGAAQARSDRRRPVRRHRRLQDRQRHARPHGRRPAADRGRRAPARVRAPDRHRRALRRRRVRRPARPPRRAARTSWWSPSGSSPRSPSACRPAARRSASAPASASPPTTPRRPARAS